MNARSIALAALLSVAIPAVLAQEDCNNVHPLSVGYDPFDSGRIVVVMGNDGPIGWSYPSLILYDENGDTLAWEEANYFALTDDQLHTLTIVESATVPTEPIYAGLELWTGFNDSLRCSWNPFVSLCPPDVCTTIYPYIWALGNDAGGTEFSWTVTDNLSQAVATGTIAFPVGGITARDSVCLPPGEYSLAMVNPSIPGDSIYFSMNGEQWNSSSSPQVELITGYTSSFTLMEACIDLQNSVHDAGINPVAVQVIGEVLMLTRAGGGPIGSADIIDSAGRLLRHGSSMRDTLVLPLGDLATGILLVRLVDPDGKVLTRPISWAR
jgi:hypothetical protein